jgi:hypothetical protein
VAARLGGALGCEWLRSADREAGPRHHLLFAGAVITSARMGFAEGAMTSGIREAKAFSGRQA